MNDNFIESILNDLEATAYWRREKANEYPHDQRNEQAAITLEDLAEAIRADPQSDAIARLRRLDQELIQQRANTDQEFDFSALTIECGDYRRRIGFSEFPNSAPEYLATLGAIYQGHIGRTPDRGLAEGADEIRRLRNAATDLRSRVSQGSYDDSQLQVFWNLTKSAGIILKISNPELGMRAGLGDGFFMSVSRDRRRPKLVNFLKALTTIIEVADERIAAVEVGGSLRRASPPKQSARDVNLQGSRADVLALARSLSRMALDEIRKLDGERPNDPAAIDSNEKYRQLLRIFAEGFERIAVALAAFDTNAEPTSLLVTKAKDVVGNVANQVNKWLSANGDEIIDWSVRIPFFAAGVAALGWAGANMTVATTAIATIVGGQKVANVLRSRNRRGS